VRPSSEIATPLGVSVSLSGDTKIGRPVDGCTFSPHNCWRCGLYVYVAPRTIVHTTSTWYKYQVLFIEQVHSWQLSYYSNVHFTTGRLIDDQRTRSTSTQWGTVLPVCIQMYSVPGTKYIVLYMVIGPPYTGTKSADCHGFVRHSTR
jgi:hypothetical protein